MRISALEQNVSSSTHHGDVVAQIICAYAILRPVITTRAREMHARLLIIIADLSV